MEVRLLGSVEVSLEGRAVALGGVKPRALLAMLALRPNEPVPANRLIEGLWGEQPPPSAPKMVQAYVSQLRKLLDGDESAIVTRGRGYELRLPADRVDAARFERLVGEAARADGSAGALAREALGLWRGPPLDDIADEPFAAAEIRRLEDLWLHARELAIDAALHAGEHEAVIDELEDLVAANPLRERLHAQRMLALYRCGRQADALEAYQHAREVLVGQVGIEPGPELRRLQQAILEQDPALDAPVRDAPAAAGPPRRPRRGLVLVAGVVAVAALAAFGISRLAGRDSLERIDGDAVGVIDPADGSITAQYAVGHAPGAIAAGGGSVWIANARDGTVSRIDRERDQVTTIDVGTEPTALAFGSGSLWVADGARGRLAQVDPRTNRVIRRFPAGNAPRGVTVAFGAVWVASPIDGRLERIDLARPAATRSLAVAGGPVALAAGHGAVWVAGEESGSVIRVEPRSGAALRSIGVGNSPAAIAVDEDAVWVANRADGTVSRIDPRTNAVSDTVRVGGNPVGLAAGDGAIWVADSHGAVLRIDARMRTVDRRVDVRGSPSALAVADGSLWTTALAPRTSHRGGTLSYITGLTSCRCVDPASFDGRTWPLLSLAYDGLLAYRRAGGSAGTALVGNLATDVPEPTDGGRTYVLQLRPDVRFSNGEAVRPEDFRASIERAIRLGRSAPYFAGIVGADACDQTRCDLRKGIETNSNAGTITIHLREPDPEFVYGLAHPLAYVLPAASPPRLSRTRPLPGTGPYRFDAFDVDRGGRLSRNPHFGSWSEEARPDGFADGIEFSFREDRVAAIRDVRRGRADVVPVAGGDAHDLVLDDVSALVLADPSHLHGAVTPTTDWLFLNVREPPFDDVRVRWAFNLAVDRRRIVEVSGGAELAALTCQVLPPGLPGYAPVCPYTRKPAAGGSWTGPDLARARRLVAESGTAGARVDVWGTPGIAEGAVRQGVQVLKRLGYRASARRVPDVERYFGYVADSRNRAQAGAFGWIADFLTPSNFLAPLTCRYLVPRSAANVNVSQFCDPRIDALFARALAAQGPEANVLWAEVDRRILRAAPIVPLVNRRSVLLVSDRVGNVQQHHQLGPLLDQFWVR